jgi:3-oxoacyl-[acyl-carrier-protein] synthase-3
MSRTFLADIEYHLPAKVVTNEDLKRENPSWDMALLEPRTGVVKRHIAGEGETALDLAAAACEKLIERHAGLREKTDALIFCTQSPDYVMPPNSCVLHEKLKLGEDVFATDITLACSGFVYGLALARGLLAAGSAKNVLLVTADTYSRFISPGDRATRVLFGDGAAVTWITAEDPGGAIAGELVDVLCATSGANHERLIIPAGGSRTPRSPATAEQALDSSGNSRSLEQIKMDGMGIFQFVNTRVPKQVKALLAKHGAATGDIDLYVFHQASTLALESLGRLLSLKPEKVFTNLREVGNTVSASIPIALKDAAAAGRLKPGQKVVVSGFGVGLSWSSALLRL